MSTAKRPPPKPTATEHRFERDTLIPVDYKGTEYCICGKPGRAGDDQHPDGSPPLVAGFTPAQVLLPTPEEDRSDEIIGEGREE